MVIVGVECIISLTTWRLLLPLVFQPEKESWECRLSLSGLCPWSRPPPHSQEQQDTHTHTPAVRILPLYLQYEPTPSDTAVNICWWCSTSLSCVRFSLTMLTLFPGSCSTPSSSRESHSLSNSWSAWLNLCGRAVRVHLKEKDWLLKPVNGGKCDLYHSLIFWRNCQN